MSEMPPSALRLELETGEKRRDEIQVKCQIIYVNQDHRSWVYTCSDSKHCEFPITTARIVKHIHMGIKFMMLIIGYDVTNKSCQKIDS